MLSLSGGMEFAVCSDGKVAKAINAIQKLKSVDDESTYNHTGLIIDNHGGTFEALWKTERSDLYQYAGCRIIVVRHRQMTDAVFLEAWSEIAGLEGARYPVPRLFLHLLGLAKYVHWKYPVCSELVAKFEFKCGFRRNWWGINPDNLADEWRISKYYDVIYEGRLPCEE